MPGLPPLGRAPAVPYRPPIGPPSAGSIVPTRESIDDFLSQIISLVPCIGEHVKPLVADVDALATTAVCTPDPH
ncbi:hypothetical protein EVAR_76751_1 [Eumeta japonica]|uniref:Uncharacterized protein n=1 Tax=Eumeta variegata TaxID=151549 RepID=A0A4C1SWA7_EUMVA|nr:hypothetical protein EVAR_76751_1 [Eumeta japonica]